MNQLIEELEELERRKLEIEYEIYIKVKYDLD